MKNETRATVTSPPVRPGAPGPGAVAESDRQAASGPAPAWVTLRALPGFSFAVPIAERMVVISGDGSCDSAKVDRETGVNAVAAGVGVIEGDWQPPREELRRVARAKLLETLNGRSPDAAAAWVERLPPARKRAIEAMARIATEGDLDGE